MNIDNLPLYDISIDPEKDIYVDFISLVEEPAISETFLAFSSNKKKSFQLRFEANKERKELLGLAMIPELPIYRDQEGEQFYVKFSAEQIRHIAQTYFQKALTNNLNVEHTKESAQSFVFQSFITDKAQGITAPEILGKDIPDGSWVVGVKITDDAIWEKVLTGELQGFSVEGLFNLTKVDNAVVNEDEEIVNIVLEDDNSEEEFKTEFKKYKALYNHYQYYKNNPSH